MSSIYTEIEKILKRSKNPLTCTDLYDKPEIRKEAESVQQVSDSLGYLWRRGLLARQPAPRTGAKSARYAYSWRSDADKPAKPVTIEDVEPTRIHGFDVRKEPDGSVTLITDKLEITVKRR